MNRAVSRVVAPVARVGVRHNSDFSAGLVSRADNVPKYVKWAGDSSKHTFLKGEQDTAILTGLMGVVGVGSLLLGTGFVQFM
eukprot:CAMPEP_0185581874 /NCGR_PEP_ID=MMETSP0434-20130131/19182_1 /TAXON_ID=626734 ORGANISM="Favella taraikaensis, Strain Fe Narragansett Bay" /NCGR_SAMPLE_ID=MMETSP0434 /ASSEMBLY_ACC=CAM_ASM_000379 /LENGTH=81 /DNA_ID=CAMNT_0028200517 /DNA_START=23 /DNA_END=265 /DNA_ORIENTATION=-